MISGYVVVRIMVVVTGQWAMSGYGVLSIYIYVVICDRADETSLVVGVNILDIILTSTIIDG